MERTELELYMVSKTFSDEASLDNLIKDIEVLLFLANEHEDEDGIFYYDKLVKEAKEKKEEFIKMFGCNNAV